MQTSYEYEGELPHFLHSHTLAQTLELSSKYRLPSVRFCRVFTPWAIEKLPEPLQIALCWTWGICFGGVRNTE